VILLDTDVLIIELRFPRDARYAANRRFLDFAAAQALPLAITTQTLLEVVGKFSFKVRLSDIPKLAAKIPRQFVVLVVPSPTQFPGYANCTIADLLKAMEKRMALGDAVNAVQTAAFAPQASCLLTWNAKHYQGKLVIPALTPEEWWQANQPKP